MINVKLGHLQQSLHCPGKTPGDSKCKTISTFLASPSPVKMLPILDFCPARHCMTAFLWTNKSHSMHLICCSSLPNSFLDPSGKLRGAMLAQHITQPLSPPTIGLKSQSHSFCLSAENQCFSLLHRRKHSQQRLDMSAEMQSAVCKTRSEKKHGHFLQRNTTCQATLH